MKDITVIIPIHKFNETIENLLLTAYKSVISMTDNSDIKIMIVGPKDAVDKSKNCLKNDDVIYLKNDSDLDFYSQVNLAAKNCKTKYFSVLEFDDKFHKNWVKNFKEYSYFYSDVSVFLPLTQLISADNEPIGFINEVALASSFSNEIGFLDLECLDVYMDFNVTGAIINTEDFNEIGGLKKSLKLASWYEFLMRLCYNGKKIYTIPKIGYDHMINRDDSLMKDYQNNITPEEGTWLIKTAKQEYFFKEDRKKTFDKK